jgi:hypothetical protein
MQLRKWKMKKKVATMLIEKICGFYEHDAVLKQFDQILGYFLFLQ